MATRPAELFQGTAKGQTLDPTGIAIVVTFTCRDRGGRSPPTWTAIVSFFVEMQKDQVSRESQKLPSGPRRKLPSIAVDRIFIDRVYRKVTPRCVEFSGKCFLMKGYEGTTGTPQAGFVPWRHRVDGSNPTLFWISRWQSTISGVGFDS